MTRLGTQKSMNNQNTSIDPTRSRIDLLDAYRAIAIIWVAMFHYVYFWASTGKGDNILPYDDALAWIPLASVGHLGVMLFFLISGYVISLTLNKTASFPEFCVKRFARIWPTLLVCGAITYTFATLFGPPELERSIWEALISMTLLPPQHVGALTGNPEWQWLDGAYWSLWVEVKFYAIIGAMFFVFRKRWFEAWLAFQALTFAISAGLLASSNGVLDLVEGLVFAEYVPYFTAGILVYRFRTGLSTRTDLFALIVAITHKALNIITAEEGITLSLLAGYAIIFGLFAAFIWRPNMLNFMTHKLFLRIGRASYSFYLLHQVVGISLLILIAALFGTTASLLSLPLVFALLIFLSFQIFEHIEQPTNRWLVTSYKSWRNGVGFSHQLALRQDRPN